MERKLNPQIEEKSIRARGRTRNFEVREYSIAARNAFIYELKRANVSQSESISLTTKNNKWGVGEQIKEGKM